MLFRIATNTALNLRVTIQKAGLGMWISWMVVACSSADLSDRSGMLDPASTDETPVDVVLEGERYAIPANCFTSPIRADKKIDGYLVQDDLLLTILYPSGECRLPTNKSEFSEPGFGNRITFRVSPYYRLTAADALNMRILTNIESFRNTGRSTILPGRSAVDNVIGEDIWKARRSPGDDFSPGFVRSDWQRTYMAYCGASMPGEARVGSCTLEFFGKHSISTHFSPRLFIERRQIKQLIVGKMTHFKVDGDK